MMFYLYEHSPGGSRLKEVFRYEYPWSEDRCAAWDSGPSPISESVPAREGWECAGCRWLPGEARVYLEGIL
jgi:hypothetical protein